MPLKVQSGEFLKFALMILCDIKIALKLMPFLTISNSSIFTAKILAALPNCKELACSQDLYQLKSALFSFKKTVFHCKDRLGLFVYSGLECL